MVTSTNEIPRSGDHRIPRRLYSEKYKRVERTPAPPMHERPICPGCGKALRPNFNMESYSNDPPVEFYVWTGTYKRYGAFCTLRCCERFANAAYKAGYRRNS